LSSRQPSYHAGSSYPRPTYTWTRPSPLRGAEDEPNDQEYHLVRSRIAINACDFHVAERALAEGMHLARQCGLGLYHVELLYVQAELLLATAELAAAEQSAGEALRLASAPEAQFVWGAAAAGHLLGRSLIAQDRPGDAWPVLSEAWSRRLGIGDPCAEQTKALIQSLPG
jgi:hypothetical protein